MAKRIPKPRDRRSVILASHEEDSFFDYPRNNRKANYKAHLQLVTDDNLKNSGRVKKNFNCKDLANIQMLTPNQHVALAAWEDEKNLVLHGSAGTGKSFLAVYFALKQILDPSTEYEKLIIIRSVVPSREIGHLPGTKDEKIEEYEKPYHSLFSDAFGGTPTAYRHMKGAGLVEFECTSFLRGCTFNNCIIVVDEFQNMNDAELHTVLTRVGKNAKIIFAGDTKQNDLLYKSKDASGFGPLLAVAKAMKSDFAVVKFEVDDIVRSGFVKTYIATRELLGY